MYPTCQTGVFFTVQNNQPSKQPYNIAEYLYSIQALFALFLVHLDNDLSCSENKAWKQFIRVWTYDLCDTGAVFYQLSQQANWELIIMLVLNERVNWCECMNIIDVNGG